MELSAAIDFSTDMACLAASVCGRPDALFSETRHMPGKEASAIASWTASVIKENGFSLCDVRRWTCGSGPGSFTGLRIAASLVSGLTFQNNKVIARCVPSGQAIASKIHPNTTRILVLYDGRRGELLAFSTNNKSLLTLSSANLAVIDKFDRLCAMESQRKAIEAVLPEEHSQRVSYLHSFPVEQLLADSTTPWLDNRESKPLGAQIIYLRPPV
ncbi:MAG: hypothetical protein JW808_06595 [Victivallales bacterium]|nr:hypothetical protein [Victivallales bacterium]